MDFRSLWNKAKQFATSRDMLMFIFFVLFSTLMWYGRSSDSRRQHTINVDVIYWGNIPSVNFADSLPQSFKVTYSDKSKALIYHKPQIKPIIIDLTDQINNKNNTITITNADLQQLINDNLPPSTNIERIEPASVQTNFTRLNSKNVPITFTGSAAPATQYQLIGDISIEPSTITIYGHKQQLDTIHTIKTVVQNISNIKETLNQDIDLQPIDGINLSQQSVTIHAQTMAYTETTIQLPINIIGLPSDKSVKTFPPSVSLRIQMGIESYKHFNTTDISAMVDYNEMQKSQNGMVKVYLATETINVFDVKVSPEYVEFIIEQK